MDLLDHHSHIEPATISIDKPPVMDGLEPEKIELVDVEFEGNKSIRDQYTLSDPSEPEKSKYFKVSKRNSAPIDTYLAEGQSILKISKN